MLSTNRFEYQLFEICVCVYVCVCVCVCVCMCMCVCVFASVPLVVGQFMCVVCASHQSHKLTNSLRLTLPHPFPFPLHPSHRFVKEIRACYIIYICILIDYRYGYKYVYINTYNYPSHLLHTTHTSHKHGCVYIYTCIYIHAYINL